MLSLYMSIAGGVSWEQVVYPLEVGCCFARASKYLPLTRMKTEHKPVTSAQQSFVQRSPTRG